MSKRITSLLCLLAMLALAGCYKNDPLREKERALEGKRHKTERPEARDNAQEGDTGTQDTKPSDGSESGADSGRGSSDTPANGSNSGDASDSTGGNTDGAGESSGGEQTEKPAEDLKTLYSFEHWATVPKKKYTVPLLVTDENPASSFWVSASNEGFDFATIFGSPIKGYPVEVAAQGYKGKGVRLRTVDAGMALVSGALYSGKVNERKITNPTLFGQPCDNEPLELSFYYQYTPGKGKVTGLPGERDHASVQGVLYEITTNEAYLDKNTIKNDRRIVSRAYLMLPETKTGVWTKQTIKFAPVSEELGKSIDFKTKKYRLSIIISSSAKGDEFKGAHLSELLFDELTLRSKQD